MLLTTRPLRAWRRGGSESDREAAQLLIDDDEVED